VRIELWRRDGGVRGGQRIGCIIPAYNEAKAIGLVLGDVPSWVDRIVVADNGSADGTGDVARRAGAQVVRIEERGYGAACLGGLAALPESDIVVFLDGDYSDYPDEMQMLVDPIVAGRAAMVIGSRVVGEAEAGALTPQQRFGNWLATRLVLMIWGVPYTDLGPFRAIRRVALDELGMCDRTFGWTVEMQIKAAQRGLATIERPVRYRKRIGKSKISGTVQGSVKAGLRILSLIAREALFSPRRFGLRPLALSSIKADRH
jgi:glycosyltransferase involved in cell wall biosynthesis